MPISKIHARSVYDSRGNPTVEVDIVTETGLHRKHSAISASRFIAQYHELEVARSEQCTTQWSFKTSFSVN
jgi:enolase